MTKDTKTVLEAAMALPVKKRAEIAGRLLQSLDGPLPTIEEQSDIDAVWAVEIERRVKELDEGKAELIPYAQVMADARAILRRRKRRKRKP